VLAGIVLIILLITGRNRRLSKHLKTPYSIGIIINETELPAGGMAILKEVIAQKIHILNKNGGVHGHPLKAIYIDDQNNDNKLLELVEQSSRDTNVIAYVGCRGVSRSKILGPLLTERQIPFIGIYAFTHLFKDYPTMYTSSVGVKEAKLVFRELIKAKAKRIGFIGEKNHLLSEVYLQVLEELVADDPEISITFRRNLEQGYIYSKPKDQQLADSLKTETDFLLFLSNPASFNSFMEFMYDQNLTMPIYLGAPDFLLADINAKGYRAAEIYAINTFGIPGAQNMRMMEHFMKFHKIKKVQNEISREIIIASRIADQIGLLHEAGHNKTSVKNASIRTRINDGLKQYINGNHIYRGWLGDWYFTPEHAYDGESLLGWKPRNQTMMALAPFQFLRTDTTVQQRQVLFTNLNLVEISQVNDNAGTFYATFYLEINSPRNISLNNIDFTNATRNEINHEALIESKLIRSKRDLKSFKFYNNLYQVSGKFFFEPDLKSYPLDQQKFPITIQAVDPNQVFLVQPAQKQFRDSIFKSEGWIYNGQYMGYEQDIISSANNFYGKKKHFPYYKFSYVYIMKRTHIDFFLKTLVPLMAMLVITYFSVFIPLHEFKALAAIQVTALLSSIALYFSAYKPETEFATISDEIFIFTYIMITTLIGTSVLLYSLYEKNAKIKPFVRFYQRFVFPAVVLGFTIYVRWF
ncbi:MAG: ABC transporter substrate-binding protein, partial [Bacteroidia bacterium]